tara:strand:- start:444 stop:1109 length:666 start_codon:yes stop_codon:yes gene_type:complete
LIKSKKMKFVLFPILFSLIFGQNSISANLLSSNSNFKSIVSNTLSIGILANRNMNSFSFVYGTIKQFDAYNDVGDVKKMHANILFKSGVELSFGKLLNFYDNTIKVDMFGLNHHIKFRKFGFGLHFTSYKHNIPQIFSSKPRQYGLSFHVRFKKTNLKPYVYYTQTKLSSSIRPYELFSFGIMGNLGPLVFETNVLAPFEKNLNLDNELAQYGISIGFLIN